MTKKIITVFGATGAQGGGLARAILADKDSEFALRAVTRKPDSEAAKALAAAGAQIAVADMDDADSVQRRWRARSAPSASRTSGNTFPPTRNWRRPSAMADGAASARA